MPWTPKDARRHTKKASTIHLKDIWSRVANRELSRGSEGRAVRIANYVVKKRGRG